MILKPIKKKRVSDLIVEQIREMITSNEMEPGQMLPSERELVQTFQVSRSSLREALRILEIMGMIETRAGKGIIVSEKKTEGFESFEIWLKAHKEALEEHFEVRLVIEPDAAFYAAHRAKHETIVKMRKAVEEFKKCRDENDSIGMIRHDSEFHNLIAQATGNHTLLVLMETITRSLLEGWKATLHIPSRVEKTISEHSDILSAIEQEQDAEARNLMRKHLVNAINDLKEHGMGDQRQAE